MQRIAWYQALNQGEMRRKASDEITTSFEELGKRHSKEKSSVFKSFKVLAMNDAPMHLLSRAVQHIKHGLLGAMRELHATTEIARLSEDNEATWAAKFKQISKDN